MALKIHSNWYQKIVSTLTNGLTDMDLVLGLVLTGVISMEHSFLLGRPGTAKSLIANRISCIFKDTNNEDSKKPYLPFFKVLMNQFINPEELVGAPILNKLGDGNIAYNDKKSIPNALLIFLDELYKTNPAILNMLLMILNEREFKNDGDFKDIPLISMISASNEEPNEEHDEILHALRDRILIKIEMPHLTDEKLLKIFKSKKPDDKVVVDDKYKITRQDILDVNKYVDDNVLVPDEIHKVLLNLFKYQEEKNQHANKMDCSIRKMHSVIKLLRMVAYLHNGRNAVEIYDLEKIGKYLFSKSPTHSKDVDGIVTTICKNFPVSLNSI